MSRTFVSLRTTKACAIPPFVNTGIPNRTACRRRPPLLSLLAAFVLVSAALTGCVPAVPVPPAVQPVPRGTVQWQVEPGDVIRLHVWGNDGQSGDVPVNERGEALIPTVGRLNVAGQTPAMVEARILRGYAGRIDSTRVDIVFLRPVAVVGGVKSPSVQLTDPSQSVLSLVARSGGPVREGGDLHVYLLRVGEPVREVSTADRVADLGIRASDQLYVQDPPFAVRNSAAIQAVFQGLQFISTVITLVLLVRK
jgi:protein involved in polysaccharide export with SLBB domain